MADWNKLFKAAPNQTLEYFPPTKHNDNPRVSPPKEVFKEGAEDRKHSIVAQFLGKPPSFTYLQRALTKLWEKKGTVKINSAGSNLFIFRFDYEDVCSWVLENGPWHVQNNTMILRKWTPDLGRIEFDLCKLPIWFHLHHVPLNLYNRDGLSYVASAIGIPLYMDSVNASQSRLQYAKICIKVRADEEPPMEVEVEREDGSLTTVGVSIPWRPLVCSTCKVFGHNEKTCVKKQSVKQVWKEKDKNVDSNPPEDVRNKTEFVPKILDESTEKSKVEAAVIPEDGKGKHITPNVPVRESPKLLMTKPNENLVIKNPVFEENATPSGEKEKWSNPVNTAKNTSASTSRKSNAGKHSITSSKNIFNALLEESAALEDAKSEDNLEDLKNVEPSTTIWEELINNAKFEPKKTRVATKGAAKVLDDMKGIKKKMVAKGSKKGVDPPPTGKAK